MAFDAARPRTGQRLLPCAFVIAVACAPQPAPPPAAGPAQTGGEAVALPPAPRSVVRRTEDRGAGVLDLRCDQLVFDPTRDSTRTLRHVGAPWTGDANRSQGALLIRPAAFRAREPVDAPYRVRVHDLDGRLSLQTELDVYLSRLRNVCEVDATRAAPPP